MQPSPIDVNCAAKPTVRLRNVCEELPMPSCRRSEAFPETRRAGHARDERVNSGTQRNAGMVSHAVASTETLCNEARALMSSVSEFAQQPHEPAAA